jgi:hypothetical protein
MSLSYTKVGRQMPKLRGKPGWPPRANQVSDVSPNQKPGRMARWPPALLL